ncbi:MAG: hypothetical protein RLZZ488_641 [Pseudomonadota bacterium]|jgi:hypothetical protein
MLRPSIFQVSFAFALLSGCSFETNPYIPPKVEDEQQSPVQSTAPAAFALADAKPFCVGCHSATGSGKNSWSTAAGSEADWKVVAAQAKAAVVAGNMPTTPISANDKTRLIAYFDKLIAETAAQTQTQTGGNTSNTGGGTSGGSNTNPDPGPVVYNITNAVQKCGSCHYSGANPASSKKPLASLADFNNRTYYSRQLLLDVLERNVNYMPQTGKLQEPYLSAMKTFFLTLDP